MHFQVTTCHLVRLTSEADVAPPPPRASDTVGVWVRRPTGCARSAARRSETGSRSASRAATRSGTSTSSNTSSRVGALSAPASCGRAARRATRASRRHLQSHAKRAAANSGRLNSWACRFASRGASDGFCPRKPLTVTRTTSAPVRDRRAALPNADIGAGRPGRYRGDEARSETRPRMPTSDTRCLRAIRDRRRMRR